MPAGSRTPRRSTIEADERAAARATTPQRLRATLRGDLENIVTRALKKDAAERYPSAEAMADDLRRYLDHLPVRARADSLGYRARKFVARHRVGLAAATAVALALAASAGVAVRQARVSARERDRALLELRRAEATIDLTGFLLAEATPTEEPARHQRGAARAGRRDHRPALRERPGDARAHAADAGRPLPGEPAVRPLGGHRRARLPVLARPGGGGAAVARGVREGARAGGQGTARGTRWRRRCSRKRSGTWPRCPTRRRTKPTAASRKPTWRTRAAIRRAPSPPPTRGRARRGSGRGRRAPLRRRRNAGERLHGGGPTGVC